MELFLGVFCAAPVEADWLRLLTEIKKAIPPSQKQRYTERRPRSRDGRWVPERKKFSLSIITGLLRLGT